MPTHPLARLLREMGQDAMAVVNGKLKVYGIANLRVADGPIIPRVTTGNTQEAQIFKLAKN